MACEPSGRAILIHQDIDLGPEEICSMTFRTGEELDAWGVVRPPDRARPLHIRGQLHDTIALPFALVDAHGLRVYGKSVPGEGTPLGDPQPAAQHAEANEPITDGVNHLKESREICVRDGFGPSRRCQEPMPPPQDGLLRHRAFFAEIRKEARQETDLRIASRRGEARRLRRRKKRGDILGGRLRAIRSEDDWALPWQLAEERGQRRDDGVEGQARILTGGKVGKGLEDTVLIRRTEARQGRLIRGSNRAIHTEDLLGSMARWP